MSSNFILLTNTASSIWQRSMGAYQVAGHCRQNGITCQIIDFTDYFSYDELDELLRKFIGPETVAIGVSTTFFVNTTSKKQFIGVKRNLKTVLSDDVRQLLENIKKEYNVKIVAGGANSYQVPGDTLFDAVFHGYSEQSVVQYLHSLTNGKKMLHPKIGNTEIIDGAKDHFDIETLSHQFINEDCILPGETLPIEISRGCIFKCKFCSYPLNGKKKFDYLRDPERIKQELIHNYENYGTTNYFFTDDTFNDSTFKLEKLHKVITELPFKIKFVTYLRIDLLYAHPEQIQMLYEMGLGSVFFGIESFNPASSKAIGKGMDPDKIKKFIYELHDIHWKKEIPITCSFIIGLPGESLEKITESRAWCSNAPISDVWFPLFIKADSHYKSEFDTDYADYGYTLIEDGNWISDQMTFAQALELSDKFNHDGIYSVKPPSSWYIFGLLSYGYTIQQLKDMAVKDLPTFSISKKHLGMIKSYKKLLNEVANKQLLALAE
jgi:radical SAM superfamily enzyme YgiQ (UPF0313 family)